MSEREERREEEERQQRPQAPEREQQRGGRGGMGMARWRERKGRARTGRESLCGWWASEQHVQQTTSNTTDGGSQDETNDGDVDGNQEKQEQVTTRQTQHSRSRSWCRVERALRENGHAPPLQPPRQVERLRNPAARHRRPPVLLLDAVLLLVEGLHARRRRRPADDHRIRHAHRRPP